MRSLKDIIYLDASATCPPHEKVIREVLKVEKNHWANPSSLHTLGIQALDILERSRNSIAKSFNVLPEQVLITSGATESSNLALKGYAGSLSPGRMIISSVEHPSVQSVANSLKKDGWTIQYWPVDNQGLIDINLLDELLSPPTKLVSLIWGQNEIGTVQPINIIATECKKRNIFFHTDATQVISQGLFDFSQLEIGALSASAHKFRGPKGIGFLLIDRQYLGLISPIQGGGGQEYGLRSGTQSVSLAHGMAIALQQISFHIDIINKQAKFPSTKTSSLTSALLSHLLNIKGISLTGHPENRLPNLISLIVCSKNNIPISGRMLVRELSNYGIFVSSGSACSSAKKSSSSVLEAINIDKKLIHSSLRISLGCWLTDLDCDYITNIMSKTIEKIALTN